MHIIFLTSEGTDKFSSFGKATHVLLIHLKSHLISCPAKLLEWVGVNVTKASSETRHGGLAEGSCQHWYGKSTWNILVLAIAPRTGGFWLQRHTWNNQHQRAITSKDVVMKRQLWHALTSLDLNVYDYSLVKGEPSKVWLKRSLGGWLQGKSYSEQGVEMNQPILTPIPRKKQQVSSGWNMLRFWNPTQLFFGSLRYFHLAFVEGKMF